MNEISTELPKLSSPNIRVSSSERVKDEQRARARTDSNVLTIQTLVGFAEKAKAKANTLAVGNLERVPTKRTSPLLKTTIITMCEDMDESANAYQAHNDPVDPGSDDGEEALDYDDDDDEENDVFLLKCVLTPFCERVDLGANPSG